MNELPTAKKDVKAFIDRRREVVAYRPDFARIAGGAVPGLFLSQLYHWADKGRDPDGWVYKSVSEWQRETMLTRYEQQSARARLVQLGLIELERRGNHGTLHFRLNYRCLLALLTEI